MHFTGPRTKLTEFLKTTNVNHARKNHTNANKSLGLNPKQRNAENYYSPNPKPKNAEE